MTTNFTIASNTKNHEFEIHAQGCSHVGRLKAQTDAIWNETAPDAATCRTNLQAEMAEQDCEWPLEAFHVSPCATK